MSSLREIAEMVQQRSMELIGEDGPSDAEAYLMSLPVKEKLPKRGFKNPWTLAHQMWLKGYDACLDEDVELFVASLPVPEGEDTDSWRFRTSWTLKRYFEGVGAETLYDFARWDVGHDEFSNFRSLATDGDDSGDEDDVGHGYDWNLTPDPDTKGHALLRDRMRILMGDLDIRGFAGRCPTKLLLLDASEPQVVIRNPKTGAEGKFPLMRRSYLWARLTQEGKVTKNLVTMPITEVLDEIVNVDRLHDRIAALAENRIPADLKKNGKPEEIETRLKEEFEIAKAEILREHVPICTGTPTDIAQIVGIRWALDQQHEASIRDEFLKPNKTSEAEDWHFVVNMHRDWCQKKDRKEEAGYDGEGIGDYLMPDVVHHYATQYWVDWVEGYGERIDLPLTVPHNVTGYTDFESEVKYKDYGIGKLAPMAPSEKCSPALVRIEWPTTRMELANGEFHEKDDHPGKIVERVPLPFEKWHIRFPTRLIRKRPNKGPENGWKSTPILVFEDGKVVSKTFADVGAFCAEGWYSWKNGEYEKSFKSLKDRPGFVENCFPRCITAPDFEGRFRDDVYNELESWVMDHVYREDFKMPPHAWLSKNHHLMLKVYIPVPWGLVDRSAWPKAVEQVTGPEGETYTEKKYAVVVEEPSRYDGAASLDFPGWALEITLYGDRNGIRYLAEAHGQHPDAAAKDFEAVEYASWYREVMAKAPQKRTVKWGEAWRKVRQGIPAMVEEVRNLYAMGGRGAPALPCAKRQIPLEVIADRAAQVLGVDYGKVMAFVLKGPDNRRALVAKCEEVLRKRHGDELPRFWTTEMKEHALRPDEQPEPEADEEDEPAEVEYSCELGWV